MALDGTQRAKVRKYLGYGARYQQAPGDEQRLEAAMDAIATEPFDEAEIVLELQTCEWVDQQLRKVAVTALAIKDGAIEMRAAYQLQTVRSLGTQAAARIANTLGMDLKNGGGFATVGPIST
jgi:hypothetical protein